MSDFDLLGNTDIVAQTQESLVNLRSRKKGASTTLYSLSDVHYTYLPFDHVFFPMLTGIPGLKSGNLYEFIGGEGIGKSTLIFTLFGMFMRTSNSPCLYVNTEGTNKMLSNDRILRCLDSRPAIAKKMLDVLSIEVGQDIVQSVDIIEDWVTAMRYKNKNPVPKNVPLIIAIDTISKLMSPGEAEGQMLSDPDDQKSSSKKKGLGEASNLEFSKLIHYWCRRLPTFCDNHNVMLMVVSHQNQKINMAGGFGGFMMSADTSASYNKTKRGGNATNQNAAIQFILKRTGFLKDSANNKIGHTIALRVDKSSLGPDSRELSYCLKTSNFNDDFPTNQEYALNFNEGVANKLVEDKILGLSVSKKRFSSSQYDSIDKMTADDAVNIINTTPELCKQLFNAYDVDGYTSRIFDDFEEVEQHPDENEETIEQTTEENKNVSNDTPKTKRRGRPKKNS